MSSSRAIAAVPFCEKINSRNVFTGRERTYLTASNHTSTFHLLHLPSSLRFPPSSRRPRTTTISSKSCTYPNTTSARDACLYAPDVRAKWLVYRVWSEGRGKAVPSGSPLTSGSSGKVLGASLEPDSDLRNGDAGSRLICARRREMIESWYSETRLRAEYTARPSAHHPSTRQRGTHRPRSRARHPGIDRGGTR